MAGISSKAAGGLENKFGITGKEIQNKEFSDGNGLEEYDFESRFYDPQTGRWQSQDPLADKWNGYSPYNYVANDPLSGIDPDGKDIIFINDPKAAAGAEHGAVIIGNAKDGWFYYSMNGTGEGQSPYGDSKNPDAGTLLGFGQNIKEVIETANTVNKKEKHEYRRYVHIKTTQEEDNLMKKRAKEAALKKKYVVVGQSCINVQKAAFDALAYNRIGNQHQYLHPELNAIYAPNSWIKVLPEALFLSNVSL